MNRWTCGHTSVGTCSRCNSILAWKAHLLVEICDEALDILEKHDPSNAKALTLRLAAALTHKGE